MKRMRTTCAVGLVTIAMAAGAACNRTEPEQQTTTTTAQPASPADQQYGQQGGDAAISTSVQARFYSDDTVRGRDIDVSTSNGVVTLSGTVDNEASKQQAVNLARSVEGVSRVEDRLTVREGAAAARESAEDAATGTAGRAADAVEPGWITTKIQAQYFVNPEVKPWNVDVTTASGGVVTLEGTVETEQDKTEAVRIARETEGVTRVEDRLRVRGEAERAEGRADTPDAPGVTRPDVWLTSKIQAKYFVDDLVKARNINVDTQNAVVTLKGPVASEAERRQAVALARNTEGVRDVTDQLEVDPALAREQAREPMPKVDELTRPDAWITTKIQAQYFMDAEVKGHKIDVDTNNGVVTLKGTVANAQQKSMAEQIARETEGVKQVVNQLAVSAGSGG